MCLNIGGSILFSKKEIQIVLYSQCTVGAPLLSAKDSVYFQIALVFFTDFYMHITSPEVESEYISS